MARGRAKEMQGGPLTLEKYHRFFVDPWDTRLTIDHLNHVRPPAVVSCPLYYCCCFCFRWASSFSVGVSCSVRGRHRSSPCTASSSSTAPTRATSCVGWWGRWTCSRRGAPRCTARRARRPTPSSPPTWSAPTWTPSGGRSAPSAPWPSWPRRPGTRRSRWSPIPGRPTSCSPGAARGPSGAAARPTVTSPKTVARRWRRRKMSGCRHRRPLRRGACVLQLRLRRRHRPGGRVHQLRLRRLPRHRTRRRRLRHHARRRGLLSHNTARCRLRHHARWHRLLLPHRTAASPRWRRFLPDPYTSVRRLRWCHGCRGACRCQRCQRQHHRSREGLRSCSRDSDLSGAHRRCRRVTQHHSGARRSGVLNLRRRRNRTGTTSDRHQLQRCSSHLLPPCICSSNPRRRKFSGAGRRIRECIAKLVLAIFRANTDVAYC